jgi:predicted ATPase/GAF domain-containing protein/HPt (histidine-containing phosphotransfer) domain-containing protein
MNDLDSRYSHDGTALSRAGRVFGAIRKSDGQAVAIKQVATDYPTAEQLTELRHEYALLRRLSEAGAPVSQPLELVRHGRNLALVLARAPGRSLSAVIEEGPVDAARFCDLAIAVTRCLEAVHACGIVHKDIKPSHYFVDDASGSAILIDFGMATVLTQEHARPAPVDRLEGTLAYIAPEQTGRMNRSVDRRSDLYSLGVSLYELATGQRPFEGKDALELIHAHLARTPQAPSALRPELPAMLSAIVLRLLEKVPDARYQTASGLSADLERLRALVMKGNGAERFELGRNDHSDELRIPEELYGRSEQRSALIAGFERVRQGATELLLITGSAGVGKSALVNEVHRELVRGGHFVSGKFDQFDRSKPYSALATACGEIVRVHLAASPSALGAWKQRITTALGEHARVVADVVPELELALGPQPPLAPLLPSEAQNRFERSFRQFLQASATDGWPLVLFLDDLQWADSASLAVLRQVLSSGEQKHLLVIGSYRGEEVDSSHPLTVCLEALRERLPIHRIEIGCLGAEDVQSLVSDALPFRSSPVEPLAQLILKKTSGNPFFVGQFLQRLAADNLLVFDRERGFAWDIDAIAALEATDNVIDLVVKRLARLDPRARELLPLAACVGHTFSLSTLVLLAEWEPREVMAGLQAAAMAGLIVPLDENHRLLSDLVEGLDPDIDARYRFTHDRVQQAAYGTIPEAQRSRVHLRIGRQLLAESGADGPSDTQLFEVVGQLNRGREHLADEERRRLARLDLRAAERASAATAHEAALGFANLCLELLGTNPWLADHASALGAHQVAIATHYLAREDEQALVLIQAVEENAKNVFERVTVRNFKTDLLTSQGKLREALLVSTQTLALLGDEMPDPDDKPALGALIGATFGAYQAALSGRDVASLCDLPSMTEPDKLARLATMAQSIPAAFQSNPELNVLLTLRAVQLSLTHGTGPSSPFFYAVYGIVHYIVTNDYARGFQFGELALELSRRPEYAAVRCRAHFIFATHLSPWVRPISESFEHHELGVALGLDGGDLIHAAYCMGFGVAYHLYAGEPLADVESRIANYRQPIAVTGDVINLSFLTSIERLIHSLTGRTKRFGSLDGAGFSEQEFERNASPTTAALYGAKKAMARYLAGDAEAALRATEEFLPLPGIYYNAEHAFYHGLACAEMAANATGERRDALLASLDQDIAKFALWSGFCAENFGAQHELLRAEALAVRGESTEAADAYERAIVRAEAAPALHHLALACERAGRFHHRQGRDHSAKSFLLEACSHYERWGATRKVAQLREQFPKLVRLGATEVSVSLSHTATTATGSGNLDLTSAMRATQAIASELELAPLVQRLMEILIENAGATRGCLVLPKGAALELSASVTLEPAKVELDLHESLENSAKLPASIVRYCARSLETVVLSDAGADPRFTHDPLVLERKGRSIACLPLLHQKQLAGVLYLENEAGTGVFHPGRVARLEFLAGHAAVALRNAVLYDELQEANATLEQRVASRTAELWARNADMRRVLDNVSQGLLTVDLQGRLASERSAVVDRWFGAFAAGTDIRDYFKRVDPKFAEYFKLAFEMLAEDVMPECVVLAQLPTTLNCSERQYRLSYEPIRSEGRLTDLLIVVDDVTEAVKRAREESEQQEELAISRWVSRDRAILIRFFEEGRALVDRIRAAADSPDELRSPLHTLKGSAAMLEFKLLASLCHQVETGIDEGGQVREALSEVSERWTTLEASLELLIGRDGRNQIELSRSELEKLVARLKSGADAKDAVETLERWQLEPLARPLGHLGERARELCHRLHRGECAPLIDDGGLLGDPRLGAKLWAALVHLVRNAVDHGFETEEERSALGKPPAATLELRARQEEGVVCIEIADDGRGVAWQAVRERAEACGLPSTSRADLVEALFGPSFSTRTEVTEISGRGVGLSAMRQEVAALGGSVELKSEPGQGCRWTVRIPAAALGVCPARVRRESVPAPRAKSERPPATSPATRFSA